jgi:hypothetical protein
MLKNYRHVRKATVVKNSDGQRFKLGGYRPEAQSSKDPKYSAHDRSDPCPSAIDLRPYMTPVENQGNSNSCTANAMAGAYEYLANRLNGQSEDVSRLFIYYNARQIDGTTDQDEGTYLKNCVQVLRKYGACSEKTWSFNIDQILEQPPKSAYREAAQFRVEAASRVDVDLHTMRSCLADGYPFAFGLQLFASFQKAGSNGLVPMPDPDREKHDGGHAMLCVGYSDPDQVFIVRNSWGEGWGDRGYCYIPYDYMTKTQYNGDCWTIRQVSDLDLSQGIERESTSLFSDATAAIASAIQTPGAIFNNPSLTNLFEDTYHVEYEEQFVYVAERGFISIDTYDDLESLYDQEYEETYEDDEEVEDWEDTEDSYEEEFEEDEEETEEEEDEEVEDSYEEESEDEESEEYEDEEESEEIEDSYEEESEDEETEDSYEEDSEETEDDYEESEEYEEESEEIEDSYEEDSDDEETEDSYEEDSEDEGDDY